MPSRTWGRNQGKGTGTRHSVTPLAWFSVAPLLLCFTAFGCPTG